ncbi:MAG: amidohydrolase family protein [Gemmatimonadales bacterium]
MYRPFALAACLLALPLAGQGATFDTLVIRNARVIDGSGNPTRGPFDIVVAGGRIIRMPGHRPTQDWGGAHVLDATGMTVMPGIIDQHGHTTFRFEGRDVPRDYVYRLWLAHGITTIRDVGSNGLGDGLRGMVEQARLAAQNRISAPTIYPYVTFSAANAAQGRERVRQARQQGATGLKLFQIRPDVWEAVAAEAASLNLPIATDMKIQEYDALDMARLGIRSMEHWYGIPDAAIPGGIQRFPADYNYDEEDFRFRWAGDLWRQADPTRLSSVLDSMIAHRVTWDPTLAVYEANRDLTRARNLPWFADYGWPSVLRSFEPNPQNHASYHFDWTSTDEVMWRDNYRIWMDWLRVYGDRGGNITVGSDAGYLYHLYGFATIREMEMQQEAGFSPLEVIRHATANGARSLGLTETGVVREGFEADLVVVDGNPLHNLKVLYGIGIQVLEGDQLRTRGGVRWTIRDGIVFDARQLLAEVREMVAAEKTREANN